MFVCARTRLESVLASRLSHLYEILYCPSLIWRPRLSSEVLCLVSTSSRPLCKASLLCGNCRWLCADERVALLLPPCPPGAYRQQGGQWETVTATGFTEVCLPNPHARGIASPNNQLRISEVSLIYCAVPLRSLVC